MSEGEEAATLPAETFEKMTLLQLAEFGATEFVNRCVMEDGAFAGQTILILTARQAAGLEQISKAISFLAHHEALIKNAIKQASYRKRS